MSTTFITGQTLGTLRNNFTGNVGCKITPASRLIITDMGRWVVAGNSGSHTLIVYSGSTLASVVVNTSGATAAQFLYAALPSPLAVAAGTGYFIESSETNGGDQWYGSDTVVTHTADAAVNGSASTQALDGAGVNHSHGPISFKYIIATGDWTADVGYQAMKAGSFPSASFLPVAIRSMMLGNQYQIIGGEDATQGDPATPCIRLDNQGRFRFRWKMASGTRTISINVKQAINISPRPTLIVKANPDIGINSDQSATAGAGTGWVTIGPITVNPSSDGAVWVEVWNNLITQMRGTPCYVDHAVRT